MGSTAAPLRNVLIESIGYRYSPEEKEAAAKPPYPLPEFLHPYGERVQAELLARVPQAGEGPWVTCRMLAREQRYASVVRWQLKPQLDFRDAACLLLAVGALTVTDAYAIIDALANLDDVVALRRQIVLTLRDSDQLDKASAAADEAGDYAWICHRDIAQHFVRIGDANSFFAGWSRYQPSKERQRMDELKSDLVINVARNQGWRAAVVLTAGEKRIGPKYTRLALQPVAEEGHPEELTVLLDGAVNGPVLSELDKLDLLVRSVTAATDPNPESDHPLLAEIVDRIIAVDPTVDKQTMRRRDWLLYSLWPVIGERDTLDRVRRAIRTPTIKRDMTRLPRECRTE